mgnify:FL=1
MRAAGQSLGMRITGNARRKASLAAVVAASTALPLVPLALAEPAFAHGTMQNPPSRALVCRNENPENPKSEACKEAVRLGGTQPLYDWNEVNIPDAAGRHREIIPDGKLCSAGRDKYRGLDQARADWPATPLTAGAQFTFTYRATAPHRGSFELYVTKDGYDPTKPLRWSDLESTPFVTVTDPPLVDGAYTISARLPNKSGRHLIYAIWQRSDSPEAFYSCSDVIFNGGSGGSGGDPAPAPGGSAPSTAPSSAPTRGTTPPPTTVPEPDHRHPLPSPTPTPTAGSGTGTGDPMSRITTGIGVHPAKAARGRSVTVSAVCSASRVKSVASTAFRRRTAVAPAGSTSWYPTLPIASTARTGRHVVQVRCADGGVATAVVTVTGSRSAG